MIPLPTNTTCGRALIAFFFFEGAYPTSIKRGPGLGDELPTARNPPNSLSSFPASTFTVSPVPLANSWAFVAIHAGFLILEGVCTKSRARVIAFEIAIATSITSFSFVATRKFGLPAGSPVLRFQR